MFPNNPMLAALMGGGAAPTTPRPQRPDMPFTHGSGQAPDPTQMRNWQNDMGQYRQDQREWRQDNPGWMFGGMGLLGALRGRNPQQQPNPAAAPAPTPVAAPVTPPPFQQPAMPSAPQGAVGQHYGVNGLMPATSGFGLPVY